RAVRGLAFDRPVPPAARRGGRHGALADAVGVQSADAGRPVRAGVARVAVRGVRRLINMYGIAETTVHVTYRPVSASDATRAESVVGVPIRDLTLYVLDPAL